MDPRFSSGAAEGSWIGAWQRDQRTGGGEGSRGVGMGPGSMTHDAGSVLGTGPAPHMSLSYQSGFYGGGDVGSTPEEAPAPRMAIPSLLTPPSNSPPESPPTGSYATQGTTYWSAQPFLPPAPSHMGLPSYAPSPLGSMMRTPLPGSPYPYTTSFQTTYGTPPAQQETPQDLAPLNLGPNAKVRPVNTLGGGGGGASLSERRPVPSHSLEASPPPQPAGMWYRQAQEDYYCQQATQPIAPFYAVPGHSHSPYASLSHVPYSEASIPPPQTTTSSLALGPKERGSRTKREEGFRSSQKKEEEVEWQSGPFAEAAPRVAMDDADASMLLMNLKHTPTNSPTMDPTRPRLLFPSRVVFSPPVPKGLPRPEPTPPPSPVMSPIMSSPRQGPLNPSESEEDMQSLPGKHTHSAFRPKKRNRKLSRRAREAEEPTTFDELTALTPLSDGGGTKKKKKKKKKEPNKRKALGSLVKYQARNLEDDFYDDDIVSDEEEEEEDDVDEEFPPRKTAINASPRSRSITKPASPVITHPGRRTKAVFPIKLGIVTIHSLGTVVWDRPAFHNERYIWPVGYKSSRVYLSMKNASKSIPYWCEISDGGESPIFRVTPWDDLAAGVESSTATGAWSIVMKRVNEQKTKKAGRRVFTTVSGPAYFGLYHPLVMKMIQELPGAEKCSRYQARRFDDTGLLNSPHAVPRDANRVKRANYGNDSGVPASLVPFGGPPRVSRSGAARLEPVHVAFRHPICRTPMYNPTKTPPTSLSNESLSSRTKRQRARLLEEGQSDVLAYQNKYSDWVAQGRWHAKLRINQSTIHGYGVFAMVPFQEGDIVAEFTGQVVRQSVADVNERRYRRSCRQAMLFRIDKDMVLDATRKGNLASVVNHSCDPNCESRILPLENGYKKVVLVCARRDIRPGEEVTFDYRYSYEGAHLPCRCGAEQCLGWMN